jgi:hypothetical protein
MVSSALPTVSLVEAGLELDAIVGICQSLVKFPLFQISGRSIRKKGVILPIRIDRSRVAFDGSIPVSFLEGGITLVLELWYRYEKGSERSKDHSKENEL